MGGRRSFVGRFLFVGVAGSLIGAYGTFASFLARFVYPARPARRSWVFVRPLARFAVGTAVDFTTPTGATLVIARNADTGTVSDFIALSSVCPHLGCQVHWQPNRQRFFCPCHNGAFAPDGSPILGPPAKANQSLPRFALSVDDGLLFVEVPSEVLAQNPSAESGA